MIDFVPIQVLQEVCNQIYL